MSEALLMYLLLSKIPAEIKVKRITPAFNSYHKIITEHCIITSYLQVHLKTHPGLTTLD